MMEATSSKIAVALLVFAAILGVAFRHPVTVSGWLEKVQKNVAQVETRTSK